MKKRIAAALVAALLFTGCSGGEESAPPTEIVVSAPSQEGEVSVSAFPAEVCGVTVAASVSRAVSLSPAVTEIIAELGFADRLVGASSYCDYPEGLDLPRFGSSENPDIEGITALAPEAVFTLSALAERDIYALESAGIAVIKLSVPNSMEGFAALYRDIAAAFYGREQTSEEKKTEISAQIGSEKRVMLEDTARSVSCGSFVYVTEKGTLAGAGTFENAVLSLSGENLCKAEGYCESASVEGVPAYVIADSTLSESDLRADAAVAEMLDAGAAAVFVSSRCFERPTTRTAEVFGEISGQISGAET